MSAAALATQYPPQERAGSTANREDVCTTVALQQKGPASEAARATAVARAAGASTQSCKEAASAAVGSDTIGSSGGNSAALLSSSTCGCTPACADESARESSGESVAWTKLEMASASPKSSACVPTAQRELTALRAVEAPFEFTCEVMALSLADSKARSSASTSSRTASSAALSLPSSRKVPPSTRSPLLSTDSKGESGSSPGAVP
mmetsp:Transcript_13968/g.32647  ORF Transcript_13968/g.32647 Transcript_13968/m.32647 type:complete len:206 (-) Transcript_13968:223-840(-)